MLKLGLGIIGLSYILSYYLIGSEIGQHIYFIGHAIGVLICSTVLNGNKELIEAFKGFAIGRVIDEFIYFVFDWPESNLSYSLIFVIGLPLVGFAWRNYRKQTENALKWTGIATLAKWLVITFDKWFL